MSTLILAVVASICLAVLPQNLTNEYADNKVTYAATEVIDGVEYEVIYLDGDNAANKAKIKKDNTVNYRYVLMTDWDLRVNTNNIEFTGHRVIFDLHGHTVISRPWSTSGYCQLVFVSAVVEITDSVGTGTFDPMGGESFTVWGNCHELIISGGNFPNASIGVYGGCNVTILGGNFIVNDQDLFSKAPGTITWAPYLAKTYDATGKLTAVRPYDAYAVSTTPNASGIYNYVYGYQWEISCAELRNLTIPTDRDYYIWGRFADGAYKYLYAL